MSDRQISNETKVLIKIQEFFRNEESLIPFKLYNEDKTKMCIHGAIVYFSNEWDVLNIQDILIDATKELFPEEIKPENRKPHNPRDFNSIKSYDSFPHIYMNNYYGIMAIRKIVDRAITKSLEKETT